LRAGAASAVGARTASQGTLEHLQSTFWKIWMRPSLPVTHFLSTRFRLPTTPGRRFRVPSQSTGGVLIVRAGRPFQPAKNLIALIKITWATATP